MKLTNTFLRRFLSLSITLLIPFLISSHAFGQDPHLAQSSITLKTGKTTTVEVSSSNPLPVDTVNFSVLPVDRLTIKKSQGATAQSVILTITAQQQTGTVAVSVTVSDKTLPLQVTVQPLFAPGDTLPFTPALPDTLELKRNETKTFLVTTGTILQSSDLKPGSTDEHFVLTSFDGQQLTIRAMDRGTAQVTIGNTDRVNLKTIGISVKEAPQNVRVSPSELTIDKDAAEADLFASVSLIGLNSKDVTTEIKNDLTLLSDNQQVLQVNPANKKVKGLKKGDTQLKLVASDGTIIGPLIVHVTVKPTDADFTSEVGFILKPNQSTNITAVLKNGDDVADLATVTKWDYVDDESKLRVVFAPSGQNMIRVTALPGTDSGKAKLKALFNGAWHDLPEITIQTFIVTDFKPLQVRFDMVDQQTGRDLFGKKATDDFHIAKIRLFNKLRDSSNIGNSILVYGESLEVNIALEIKRENGKWETLKSGEYKDYFGNTNEDPPDNSDPNVPKPFFPCTRTHQPDFIARYRPLTFEMVANTHDRRDDRSTRSRILLGMNSASSLVSFITAIAVPGPGSDLPLGLDKFRNLLIPSFERLYPNMRELQRQNILSMAMRQLEEVPFGSDITRIVFFPKKPIKGVVPGILIRIAGVSISDSCAEVAIIKKNGQP